MLLGRLKGLYACRVLSEDTPPELTKAYQKYEDRLAYPLALAKLIVSPFTVRMLTL